MNIPVSVVIPYFCNQKTILDAIISINSQIYSPEEIIIVDDGSTDNSLDYLYSIAKDNLIPIVILAAELNSGPATARNMGWEIATQTYVAFLDADDTWDPYKLYYQYEYLKLNPNTCLIGHLVQFRNRTPSTNILCDYPAVVHAKVISKYSMLFKNPFLTPSVVVKKDTPFRFKSGKRYAEDINLWLNIAFSGRRVVKLNVCLAFIHKPVYGSSGLSASLLNMEKGELENYFELFREKKITFILLLSASAFSIAKFMKRLVF